MILIKLCLLVVVLLATSLFLEIARIEHGVPISLMDLIFCLAIFSMWLFILRGFFIKYEKESYFVRTKTKKLKKNLFLFSFMAIPFGAWSIWGIWTGKVGLFDYFPGGVRGAVHGYTLISLGLLFLIMWVYVFFKIIKKMNTEKRHIKN